MNKISVIIPTLNAKEELIVLIKALCNQKQKFDELIVIDSSSADGTKDYCKSNPLIKFMMIERKDFDHGRTRDLAFKEAIGDIVVFLTQDALPANDQFLSELIAPLSDRTIAVATGRQIPRHDATRMEQLVRKFNYPNKSCTRSIKDLHQLGIKTFFCSDVCAAYNRDIYYQLGGFEYPIKTNEDMFFAAKAINAGYKVAYVAEAVVYHSHNFTLREQYKRNYEQGYEIEKHRHLLGKVAQEKEGVKMVQFVSKELLKNGQLMSFIHFGFDCIARLLGSMMGKRKARKETV